MSQSFHRYLFIFETKLKSLTHTNRYKHTQTNMYTHTQTQHNTAHKKIEEKTAGCQSCKMVSKPKKNISERRHSINL